MFLWVRLVVDTLLEQQSIYDLQTTVHNLPSELTGVYVHILKRLEAHRDDRQKARIRGIFVWITLARRPLKTWEICDALVLGTASQGLTKQTILHKEILDLCKPLIEEHRDNTVVFIHFSVQRFLLSPEASGPYLQLEAAQRQVGATCCRYLMTCEDFFSNVKTLGTYKQIALGLHSLFSYVKDHGRTYMIDCKLIDERETRRNDFESYVRAFLHQSLSCGPAGLGIPSDQEELCQHGPVWHISLSISHYLNSISKEEVPRDSSGETSGILMEQDLSPIEKAYACYQKQFETLLQGDRTVPQLVRWRSHNTIWRSSAPDTQLYHTCADGLGARTQLRASARQQNVQSTSILICNVFAVLNQHEQDVAIPRLALSKHRVKTLDRGTGRLGGTQSSEGEPESVTSPDADVMSSSTRSFPEQQNPHPMASLEENPDRNVSGPLVVTSDPALSPSNGFDLDFSTLENADVLLDFDFDSFLQPLQSEEVNDFLRNNPGSSASALSQLVKKYSALEHSGFQENQEAFAKLRALCEQMEWRESVLLLLDQGNGGSLSEFQRLMDKAIKLNIPRTDTSFHALQDRARVKLQRVPTAIPTSSKSAAQTILVTPPTPGLLASNDVENTVDISSNVQTPVDRSVKVYELRDDWYDVGTGTYRGTYVKSHGINDHYYLGVSSKTPEQEPLLSTPILEEGNYQKQVDTRIVWVEVGGRDMCLSFLEAEVCTKAWDDICQAQQKMSSSCPDQDPAQTASARSFVGTDPRHYVEFCQSYGSTIEAAIKMKPRDWPDRPLTELLRSAWDGWHYGTFSFSTKGLQSHDLLNSVSYSQQQPARHYHTDLQHCPGLQLSATEQLHARYVFDATLSPGLDAFLQSSQHLDWNLSDSLEEAWKETTPAEISSYLDTAIHNGIKPLDSLGAQIFVLEKRDEMLTRAVDSCSSSNGQ
ncbi:hypothetical protein LTR70_009241 [Exophiala xenobiotica]|uniref:Uncharacterized protein n=1 Tax=Lithohypha guttulata TaxID=1690604 RepID=A0ABR0K2P0_9EURO|nr:hypothetical protein LTR24_008049 [Lithohypha guttulata]KAK5310746.1 hypothetical protein LTR70_009241 [Exophiala xenobiotica]